MSLCHRKRLDAATSWAHRVKLNGAEITYFQSLSSKYGDKSEAEIKELRYDAKAREGGYHGPWPSESELTLEQGGAVPRAGAARAAGHSRGMAIFQAGGKEKVEELTGKPVAQVSNAELTALHAATRLAADAAAGDAAALSRQKEITAKRLSTDSKQCPKCNTSQHRSNKTCLEVLANGRTCAHRF